MNDRLSAHICQFLRHRPEKIGLEMDIHGWVSTEQLIRGINEEGKYKLDIHTLEEIVANDEKGRYRFSDDKTMIKACQGHSVPWVIPEMEYRKPPEFLYHGTTCEALGLIKESGAVLKMKRHAVHMQEDMKKAWLSASRWRRGTPVVLKIAAGKLYEDGAVFGITENDVWCTEKVPTKYITEEIYTI